MTKEEAHDFIALHYMTYINKLVYFKSNDITARVKAIDVIEGDGGNYTATCYLENPDENDPSFKNHIFSHISLEDLIKLGQVV